jgi:hypothetical protein
VINSWNLLEFSCEWNVIILIWVIITCYVKWVPCHQGMVRPLVADRGEGLLTYGGWLRMYWISSCSQPTGGGPPAWGLGRGQQPPHQKKLYMLWIIYKCLGSGQIFWHDLILREGPLGRPRHRWEGGIRMDLREMGWGIVEWILLAQDRGRWQGLL